MYQKTTIIGRLGQEPEMRYMPDGNPVTNFSVAVNRKLKDGQQETTWFAVSAWGRLAENCSAYLQKGRLVYVEGRLKSTNGGPRIWYDRDGNPHASFEVMAFTVTFLGGGNGSAAPQPQSAAAPAAIYGAAPLDEGDIPF